MYYPKLYNRGIAMVRLALFSLLTYIVSKSPLPSLILFTARKPLESRVHFHHCACYS